MAEQGASATGPNEQEGDEMTMAVSTPEAMQMIARYHALKLDANAPPGMKFSNRGNIADVIARSYGFKVRVRYTRKNKQALLEEYGKWLQEHIGWDPDHK